MWVKTTADKQLKDLMVESTCVLSCKDLTPVTCCVFDLCLLQCKALKWLHS